MPGQSCVGLVRQHTVSRGDIFNVRVYFNDGSGKPDAHIEFYDYPPYFPRPIPSPTLVTFSDSSLPNFTPTLDWNDVTPIPGWERVGPISYILEYADNASFNGVTSISGITESQYTIPTPLTDGTYYWRVKAIAADGTQSYFSNLDSFVIIPTFTEWTTILLAVSMIGYLFWRKRWMYA